MHHPQHAAHGRRAGYGPAAGAPSSGGKARAVAPPPGGVKKLIDPPTSKPTSVQHWLGGRHGNRAAAQNSRDSLDGLVQKVDGMRPPSAGGRPPSAGPRPGIFARPTSARAELRAAAFPGQMPEAGFDPEVAGGAPAAGARPAPKGVQPRDALRRQPRRRPGRRRHGARRSHRRGAPRHAALVVALRLLNSIRRYTISCISTAVSAVDDVAAANSKPLRIASGAGGW